MYKISIKDLRLRTYIGFNPEEKIHKQDVLINYWFEFNSVGINDQVENSLNYKSINKSIMKLVENSNFNLIETLVDEVVGILQSYNEIVHGLVNIEKPGALRYTDSVGVTKSFHNHLNRNDVIISIGSNINPQSNIKKVKKVLSEIYHNIRFSESLETIPIGLDGDENFINLVCFISTDQNYKELKDLLNQIEIDMGRVKDPTNKWISRVIDLDITSWNGYVINEDFYKFDFLKQLVMNFDKNIKY